MNNVQLSLINLISISQFGSIDSGVFNDVDMNALYDEATVQAVLGLVAPMIPSNSSTDIWEVSILQQKMKYIRYCYYEKELVNLLNSRSIPFVILKGNSSSIYYRNPSHRTMGDIDFLVKQNYFEDTRKVLNDYGFVEDHSDKRHVVFHKDGLTFELHHHFSNELVIESYLIKGLDKREYVSLGEYVIPVLPKLVNGIVLLDHMREHLVTGLGLRQVVDWMMFAYRELDDDYWYSDFQKAAKDIGLEKFAITVTRLCQLYLGLTESISWCKSADESLCCRLIENLLITGNFGMKNKKGNSVETVNTSIKREGLFHWLQRAGEHNWKAFHKHQWLKPLCWFYQIFRYAKQGISTGRSAKQIKGDLDRSKERVALLKELGID